MFSIDRRILIVISIITISIVFYFMFDKGSEHSGPYDADYKEQLQKHYKPPHVLLEKVDLAKNEYGADSIEVLNLKSELASSYWAFDKYEKAEETYKEIIKNPLDENNSVSIFAHFQLANLYSFRKDYEKAKPLYEEGLRIFRQTENYQIMPSFPSFLQWTADNYLALGEANKAIDLYEKSLERVESIYGKKHINTAGAYYKIGNGYRVQKDYQKAEEYFKNTLALYEDIEGKEHPIVADSLFNLGSLYFEQEKYLDAEPYYQKAVRIYEKQMKNPGTYIKKPMANLCYIYQKTQNISSFESSCK